MKTITLQEAVRILENSSAVIIDDSVVTYANPNELENNESAIFLELAYTDDEGLTFQYEFAEGDNNEITIVGSSMFLKDLTEVECQLTILCPQNLES